MPRLPQSGQGADMMFRSIALALIITVSAAGAQADPSSIETELRRDTQALLDAIAPGDTATWDRLLDRVRRRVIGFLQRRREAKRLTFADA